MGMTADDRLVLTLRHFSECSYLEIAEILDIDEKTVKSRVFEARHRLRDLLVDLHKTRMKHPPRSLRLLPPRGRSQWLGTARRH